MIQLLAISSAAVSCSVEMTYTDDAHNNGDYTIVVCGTASDKTAGIPLEGIRIRLYATEETGNTEAISTLTHTDSRGYFALNAEGFGKPIRCTITAEDEKGLYKTEQQDLNISWSGTSFDEHSGHFYVNDCDFFMERILELE